MAIDDQRKDSAQGHDASDRAAQFEGKQTWVAPEVSDMDIGRATFAGGPTFGDGAGFS